MPVNTLFGQSGGGSLASDTAPYTMGMMFSLSQPAPLTGIWFYSVSGAAALPTETLIYAVNGNGTGTIVTGTDSTSPSWSGAAGSGWVKNSYNGSVTLAASTNYRVCVFNSNAGAVNWYSATANYWSSGAGGSGLTSGIITAPNNGTAQASDGGGATYGQDGFHNAASLTYPDNSFNAGNYWIDVEVTTAAAGAATQVVYQMRTFP